MLRSSSLPVSITGLGVVCPLGMSVSDTFQKLKSFEHPIKLKASSIFEHKSKCEAVMVCGLDSSVKSDRLSRMVSLATSEAVEQSGFLQRHLPHRIGCFFGYGMPGVLSTSDASKHLGRHSSRLILSLLANTPAAKICETYNIHGPSCTVSTACSSGLQAIAAGFQSICNGLCDAAICVGADSCVIPLVLEGFDGMRSLSRTGEAKPFDLDRRGFVLSEGAGVLVIEKNEGFQKVLGRILGYGCSSNGHSRSLTSLDETAATSAMRLAMESVNEKWLKRSRVVLCSAHAAGTIAGDVAELKALENVFPDQNILVTSMKGAIGHTLGASGAIELALTIKGLNEGLAIGTYNLFSPIPSQLVRLLKHGELLKVASADNDEEPIKMCIKNSFGFGGVNSCLVFCGGGNWA